MLVDISAPVNYTQATQRLSSAAHGSEAVVRPLQRLVLPLLCAHQLVSEFL